MRKYFISSFDYHLLKQKVIFSFESEQSEKNSDWTILRGIRVLGTYGPSIVEFSLTEKSDKWKLKNFDIWNDFKITKRTLSSLILDVNDDESAKLYFELKKYDL